MSVQAVCPVCGGAMAGPHQGWRLDCAQCGFLAAAVTPVVDHASAAVALDEADRELGLESLRRRNFEEVLDRLEALGKAPRPELLDVGCAHGWFLDAALRRGYSVRGLEPDRRIGALAAGKGHAVTCGLFPDDLPAGETFDVISFHDVLEHLPEPDRAVDACHARLRDDGFLVVNLPSSRGVFFRVSALLDRAGVHGPNERMWQKGFPSPHLSYFHPEGLSRLVTRHGFREVYRGTLPSIDRRGLWKRLRYDQTSSVAASVLVWTGVTLASPLLGVLPADISLQIFKKV